MIHEIRPTAGQPSTLETGPGDHAAGRLSVLRGRVRATSGTVRYVEVSTDDGLHWDEASLTGDNVPGTEVEWEHPWTPLLSESYRVLVRITDSAGATTIAEGFDIQVDG